MTKSIFILAFLILINACSTGRYQDTHDSTPNRLPNQSELKDAIARAEPYSRGGNRNYQVRGLNYKVLSSAQAFEQTGIASWYGQKFHGHLTSNGEIYDMYAMSAAHKNLPLPTYLKVTNLANNKSVIVRVNDRGPFHQNRIVDLSYSAAYKLDMLKTGTAKVKITAITKFEGEAKKASSHVPSNKVKNHALEQALAQSLTQPLRQDLVQEKYYIQVFATSKPTLAKKTAKALAKQYSQTVNYPEENGIYRIQIGPIINTTTLNKLLEELKQGNYPSAYLVDL
tara:strand:- start:18577 stop:19425 length:849 start_codon:yes stop_codon:yes gene_type:complete